MMLYWLYEEGVVSKGSLSIYVSYNKARIG